MRKILSRLLLGLMTAMILNGCTTKSDQAYCDVHVGFLAFGDSGYIAEPPNVSGLTRVATAMKQYCRAQLCNFGVMAGDNIYPDGADGDPESSADAERFQSVFVDPFEGLGAGDGQFRLYVALGNHDWRTSRAGAFAQVAFHEKTPPFFMDGPFYSIRPPSGGSEVEIFVIDTEMLLSSVSLADVAIAEQGSVSLTGKRFIGGSANAIPQYEQEKNQLVWLEDALRRSQAKWKLVVAHHPLWESKGSKYEQSVALRGILLPMLCRYADAYIAGHQHTLELHEDNCKTVFPERDVKPLLHMVTGATAKVRSIEPPFMRWQADRYPQLKTLWAQGSVWGFAHLEIENDEMKIRFFSSGLGEQDSDNFVESFSYKMTNREELYP
ncbi:MAG: hypothetical protein GXP04_10210 [Alphaproteobacteria bacterium]|nr:hypothetical protein [Alphaproteobacteria bacterium]